MKTRLNESAAPVANKTRELTSISILPFGDVWEGQTTTTDKRFGDGKHKFTVTVPVPATDAESQEFYGCDLKDIVEAGVIQKWYGARNLDNVIAELFGKGRKYDEETKKFSVVNEADLVDPNSETAIATVTKAAMEQTWEKTARVSQSKELKKLKAEADTLVGVDEALAIIAEFKRMKAAGMIPDSK
jgi:hypothetical protein